MDVNCCVTTIVLKPIYLPENANLMSSLVLFFGGGTVVQYDEAVCTPCISYNIL